jgi:DNA-binding transcriptional regulator YiaG
VANKITKDESENYCAHMIAWRNGKISSNELLRLMHPLIKKISIWAADKYGVSFLKDDVYQELSIATIGVAGGKWDPSNSTIANYLVGWAWRIASSISNHKLREISVDYAYSDEDLGSSEFSLISDSSETDLIEEIDAKEANKLLDGISLSAIDRELASLAPKQVKREKAKRKPEIKTTRNDRLFNLRQSIGLTRPDMAEALGISLSRYAAYETGKSTNIPNQIFFDSEAIAENASSRTRFTKDLENLSMKEIIENWRAMLGIEKDEDLVKILNISQRTLKRWLYNGNKPRHSIVMTCHVKVSSIQEKRGKKN